MGCIALGREGKTLLMVSVAAKSGAEMALLCALVKSRGTR